MTSVTSVVYGLSREDLRVCIGDLTAGTALTVPCPVAETPSEIH
jgi:hypothetical protein